MMKCCQNSHGDDKSLFFRVFKAKFFPNGTILDANDFASASYAWKSILKGRELILKGALWRVGDGKQIKIWVDNWLPTRNQPKVTSPMIFGQQNSAVEVMINQSTRRWREEIIDHCFNETEAEIIKSIPLSSYTQSDTLVWPFTPNGQYTMNSRYRFPFEENSTSQPTQQSSPHSLDCWKKLWKMDIPNKIKNFVWRSCRETLPTKADLHRRKITADAVCDQWQTCSHALFFCSDVQGVWAAIQQWQWLSTMQGKIAMEIFSRALEEDKDPSLLAYTVWTLWNRRNKARANETQCPLN